MVLRVIPSRPAEPPRRPETRLRLFCFPYAGGGARLFHAWPQHLPAWIEVCAIRLPGRETRIGEAPLSDMASAVRTVARETAPWRDLPYALFGHSLGGLIAFELARFLRREGDAGPTRLLVSARRGPGSKLPGPPIRALPDDAFLAQLRLRYNRMTPALLAHKELMGMLLPMLRADFTMAETYRYVAEPPLACPITAFGGLADDRAPAADLPAWAEETSGDFDLQMLPGDHFFLESEQRLLLERVAAVLAR